MSASSSCYKMMDMTYEPLVFKDREEAGALLAEKVKHYKHVHSVVFAVTNNGMPVAARVASLLHAPLDMIVTRELGVEGMPVCFGAISAGDVITIDRGIQHALHVSDDNLHDCILKEVEHIKEKMIAFGSGTHVPSSIETAIIIDDGSASAFALRAAIETVNIFHNPQTIIIASPVFSLESIVFLRDFVNDIVCLSHPCHLFAISNWYENVEDVSDKKVIQYLTRAPTRSKDHHHNFVQSSTSKVPLTSPFRYKFS